MILFILAVILSIALLIYSSNKFVDGAAAIAQYMGVSTLIIGITIIGFGTSAPEMLISAIATIEGKPELAIGNALGSNIANITLILGITAIVVPLSIHSGLIKKELPVLFITTLIAYYLVFDRHLSTIDAIILIILLIFSLTWITKQAKIPSDPLTNEIEEKIPKLGSKTAWFYTLAGLIVLISSSKLFIWGASGIAEILNISDLIIGLTVVALGTSLPELSASIAAAKKQEYDLVLGNVIGSNLFNTLGVLAIPGIIYPSLISKEVLLRDFPVVIGLIILLFIFLFALNKNTAIINRLKGVILVSLFSLYTATLITN